jgi:hypothetical protein
VLAAQMDYAYFPVALNAFAARLHYHEVVEGGFRSRISGSPPSISITPHSLSAIASKRTARAWFTPPITNPTIGARSEGHLEVGEGGDAAHVEFLRDADLVIHDAQYTAAEYPAKIGWGHSTVEYAVGMAMAANVKQLALYHHDPNRSDDAVDQLISAARERVAAAGSDLSVVGAAEGSVIELRCAANAIKTTPFLPSSLVKPASSVSEELVFIAGVPANDRAILTAAAKADGIPSVSEVAIEQLKKAVQGAHPSLIFLVTHCRIRSPSAPNFARCRVRMRRKRQSSSWPTNRRCRSIKANPPVSPIG